VLPAAAGGGRYFVRGGYAVRADNPSTVEAVSQTVLSTQLGRRDCVGTVEHLLAALAMMGVITPALK